MEEFRRFCIGDLVTHVSFESEVFIVIDISDSYHQECPDYHVTAGDMKLEECLFCSENLEFLQSLS